MHLLACSLRMLSVLMLPVVLLTLMRWEQAHEEAMHKCSIGNSGWTQLLSHPSPGFRYMSEEVSSPSHLPRLSHCSHLSYPYRNSRTCGWRQASPAMPCPNSWPRECVSLLQWRFYTKKLRVECYVAWISRTGFGICKQSASLTHETEDLWHWVGDWAVGRSTMDLEEATAQDLKESKECVIGTWRNGTFST